MPIDVAQRSVVALVLGLAIGWTIGCDNAPATAGPEHACHAICEHDLACDDESPPLAECEADCRDEFTELVPACSDAVAALYECWADVPCADDSNVDPCEAEEEAEDIACAECTMAVDADACSSTWTCKDAPVRTVVCDDTTCRCLEDDVEVDMCESEGVCAEGIDEDNAYSTAYRCCLWDDFD